MVSALSVFLLISIQANFLGIEDYGMLAIFFLVTEVVRSLSAQWINASMLRFYPAETKENQSYYRMIAVCLLSALFVPATGVVAISILYYDAFTWSIFIDLSLLLFSKSAYLFLLDMARLNDRANAFRLTTIFQSAISLLLTYLFLSYNARLENALLALIISYFSVLPFVVFRFNLSELAKAKPFVMPMVSYGLPLMLSGTLASLTSRVDRLFIADTMGLAEVGVYSALSNMLLGVMALVFMVVAMPLYPELTKTINNKAKLAKLHAKYFNTLMLVSFPALLGLCVIAEPMISLFLTDEYLKYDVELFYIMALSVFVLNLRVHYIDHGLQFTLNTGLLPFIIIISILINITLLFVLLEQYGLYGAAFSSLITNVVTLIISFSVAINKGYQYHFSLDFIKVVIASVAMAISMLLVRSELYNYDNYIQLPLLILCGVLSYFCTNVLLNTANVRGHINKVLFK